MRSNLKLMPIHKVLSIENLELSKTQNSELRTQNRRQRRHGFTLIELLVVIAILGILVTIAVASFATAQGKGRDGRRKGELDAIKKALELYKTDNSAGNYPSCPGGSAGPCLITTSANFNTLPTAVSPTYIRSVPQDPTNTGACGGTVTDGQSAGSAGLAYCYDTIGVCTGGATSQCPSYTLSSCLENGNDTGGNTYANTGCTSGRIYGFSNP